MDTGGTLSSVLFYTFTKLGVWNWEAYLFLQAQRQILLQGVKGLSLKEFTHCCHAFGSTACKVAYFT